MDNGIHFISGLPRAGSTVLAALLAQNPALHANMSSPVASLYTVLRREMGVQNEFSVWVDDTQRETLLRGLFNSYYHAIHPTQMVFDTNRIWCAQLPTLMGLFPEARVIACARHVPWVIDSFENLIRRNLWQPSAMFPGDNLDTMWSRTEALAGPAGVVGAAWHAMKQAFFSNEADRMMVLTYETLTREPERAISEIYAFLGLPPYAHDFERLSFDAREFDLRLGTPGLHDIRPKIAFTERETILPPDIWARFADDSFWQDRKQNPRGVKII